MSFSLSGSTITQSGTDANLSGLTAIAGVVTTAVTGGIYSFTTYNLVGLQLTVTGTLTLSSTEKLIFSGQGANNDILRVNSGGVFNIFDSVVLNGYTSKLPIEAIVFSLNSTGTWNTEVISLQSGSVLTAYNAIFRIPHSIWFRGTAYFEDCTFDKRGSSGDIQTNHADGALTLRACTIFAAGQSGLTFRSSIIPTLDRVTVIQARDAWNDETSFSQMVRGLTPAVGNIVDMSQWNGNSTRVVNAKSGVQFIWGGHLSSFRNEHYGTIAVFQEVTPTVLAPNGSAIVGAAWYLTDTIAAADLTHTSHLTPTGATINPAQRQVYIVASDSSGNVAMQNVLIGEGKRTSNGGQFGSGSDNRIRPRGKNTTGSFDAIDDVYDAVVWSYAHISLTLTLILKGGELAATVPCAAALSIDPLTTLSKVAATALTAAATLDDVYDLAKLWKSTAAQTNLEYPNISTQLAIGTGTNLDLGSVNIIVDATAVSAFSVNTGTNTVTIKAATLTTGTKFVKLITSGTLTFLNSAVPSSTLVYQSSAGTSVPIVVNGIISGTKVRIVRIDTNTELAIGFAGASNFSTRVTWTTDLPIKANTVYVNGLTAKAQASGLGTLTNLGETITMVQLPAVNYIANGVNGSTVTGLNLDATNIEIDANEADNTMSVQEIYAWYLYTLMSDAGMRTIFGAIAPVNTAKYIVNTAVTNLKIHNLNTTSTLMVTGGVIERSDGSSVRANGTNTVYGSLEMLAREVYTIETGVSGLTSTEATQLASIVPIKDLIEADEVHTTTTVTKKLRGTSSVLLVKNFTGTPLISLQVTQ